MNIKIVTKLTFLFCLLSVTAVPIYAWLFAGIDLEGVSGYVIATTGPLGVLVGGLAFKAASQSRNGGGSG